MNIDNYMNTITIVIRKDTRNKEIYLHRAFNRPMDAIHCMEGLNRIADAENLPCVWYTYTMILE